MPEFSEERIDIESDGQNVAEVIDSIKKNMNPDNNTVLIIDDERGIRKMVARSVKSFADNIQVYEASNGQEGLDTLEKIRKTHTRDPLLIVLDLNMPVMNGWDFIKVMKKDYEEAGLPNGIPIVVLSSTSGEKGALFMKKTVHDTKNRYIPLATVAKESCVDQKRYDAKGEKGLMAWLKYFIKES